MKTWFISLFLIFLTIVVGFTVFVKVHWSEYSDYFAEQTMIDFRDFLPEQSSQAAHDKTDTNTEPATFEGWKFAVVGDTEDGGPVTDAIVAEIAKRNDVRFVAHVGDVSSHGEESLMQAVKEQFAELDMPTYYVPGNNDLVYDEATERRTLRVYSRVFGDTPYTEVNEENAQLLFLDNSYRRIGFSDEQIDWVRERLQRSKQPYRFLFYHRPLLVPGEQIVGDDETPNSRAQNTKFIELISSYQISHIFNGHVHVSMQYTLGSTGIPVTITGGGGAAPQAILGGEAAAYYHYLIVTVPNKPNGTPHIQVIHIEQ